jgi:hypothetical protein
LTISAGGLTASAFTTQGLEINGEITSTYSVANPPFYFNGATDTGILYSYQHPVTNRLIIAAGGATSAIFTPSDVRIQSLITSPGSGRRLVEVFSNGALVAATGTTNSISARTYFEDAVNHYSIINNSVTGTYSMDMALSNVFNLTLTGNTTLDYTNAGEGSYVLLIKQDGTGNRQLTLAGGGKFIGATAVSIGTASNAKSLIQMMYIGTQSIVASQRNLINL